MRSIRSRRRVRWSRLGVDRRWRSCCPWRGSSVAIWIPERNCSPRSASQFSCTVPDLPGTRSTQAGRGVILPSCQVYDAGELTGPVGVGPGGTARLSLIPSTRTSAKRAGSSDAACRHGLMWGHTVFRVVASCRARPAMVAPSKRNCRIVRVPRRARGAHIRSSCSRNVTVWQVCSRHIQRRLNHRNLAGASAQGASITSTTIRPWPCAIQPATRVPASGLHDSTSSTRASGVRTALIALQNDEQIAPITTIKRHTAAGRVRHHPRSCEDHGG